MEIGNRKCAQAERNQFPRHVRDFRFSLWSCKCSHGNLTCGPLIDVTWINAPAGDEISLLPTLLLEIQKIPLQPVQSWEKSEGSSDRHLLDHVTSFAHDASFP